jgi:hypothetical protein
MSEKEKTNPDAPSAMETDRDVLTDEEITTISAGVTDFNSAKNANNGEGRSQT